jgi:hypothetical protein
MEVGMDEKSEAIRRAVFEEIELLAHASLQVRYEKNVPIANVPAELICGFCDDLYHPKSQVFLDAFNEDEPQRFSRAVRFTVLRISNH